MRKRVPITLAAGGRWPDVGGGFGVRFNWVRVDNRGGSNPVDVGLSANPAAGDKIDTYLTVSKGTVRCFNVAGPASAEGEAPNWPDEIFLVSALGTNVVLEVSDHPIVDMVFTT
jgi:hypothetical protein